MVVDAGEHAGLIQAVVLHLHPTFANNRIEISSIHATDGIFKSPVFQGWGTFTVGVDVHWAVDDAVSNLEHQLVFSDGGAGADLPVELPASLLLEAEPEPQPEPPVSREEIQNRLTSTSFLKPDDPRFFHGRGFQGDKNCGTWPAPHTTWQSNRKPRDDHDAPDWLTASEFEDQEHVMDAKCAALAEMIRLSNKTVVYSGAGISVASCIGQAARGSGADKSRGLDAWPSKTHYALGHLGKHGLIHGWVQQNHDGLPQKAGFPQERINEIHGSWFDPANPVVLYSGQLKGDAYPWMRHDAETADLVIVVGTSLGGLNADQVALKTAKRSMRNMPWAPDGSGGALGTVMINLQQTEQDGKASLRIFGTTDSVLPRVLEKLGLAEVSMCKCGGKFCREKNGYMYKNGPDSADAHWWDLKLMNKSTGVMERISRPVFSTDRVAVVPYDRDGNLSKTVSMHLDLRDGQRIKLTEGHNVQGAGQPAYLHIGASKPYTRPKAYGGQTMKHGPGHGVVRGFREDLSAYMLDIEGAIMELGVWWLDAAQRGQLDTLPIVNMEPIMETQ